MTPTRAAIQHRLPLLRCPDCSGVLSSPDAAALMCASCGRSFPITLAGDVAAVRLMPDEISGTKNQIQSFWGDLYLQWHRETDAVRTDAAFPGEVERLEDLFGSRRHLAVTEMPLAALKDREVCEIGSGAGAHSALFRRHGAHVTSVDITAERVFATARKLSMMSASPGDGLALQGDAERLPFADNAFDIVYSNGVLHHTENTEAAIREVHRVLKPGGLAILMLYSRHSALYWLKLLPRGVLTGAAFRFREAEWIGRITEGRPAFRSGTNPITRVYSASQLSRLLGAFTDVQLRKSSCQFGHFLPKGDAIRNRVLHALGRPAHPAGTLIYGSPFYLETPLELRLGSLCGFAWNIRAQK